MQFYIMLQLENNNPMVMSQWLCCNVHMHYWNTEMEANRVILLVAALWPFIKYSDVDQSKWEIGAF